MELELWFPQPIWHSFCDEDFHEAITYLKNLSKENPGRDQSNRGGWQSNLLPISEIPELNKVTSILTAHLNHIMSHMQPYGVKGLDISGVWANINKKHSYNARHIHAGNTFLSGCLYLQAPEESGNISFFRPDAMKFYSQPFNENNTPPAFYSKVTYKAKPGFLLIFPSWLEHEVEISHADEERISIAFDISFR